MRNTKRALLAVALALMLILVSMPPTPVRTAPT
jgi:hypothetical protein